LPLKKTAIKKWRRKNGFKILYHHLKKMFLTFLLVSTAKSLQVYDKKVKNNFLHSKNGRETLIGYTFRVGSLTLNQDFLYGR
jgi:hypothetical protein